MGTLFRKVFTKDRNPNIKDGEWIDTSLGDIKFSKTQIKDGIWKYNVHAIEWWLEEVKLPVQEQIEPIIIDILDFADSHSDVATKILRYIQDYFK